ncbi:archemetzincin [Archaeoglobales archaeon]|nr:MAG: archemetzincin [Archaeoglobales archaeon]
MKIAIQPIGFVNQKVLGFLKDALSEIFGDVVLLNPIEIPKECYNKDRRQYFSTCILFRLGTLSVTLAVIEHDIYANNLNFVFGEAELNGKRAIISLYRLKPELYGQKNDYLFKLRALKEAMHELGHVFGLKHCDNRHCVMFFSNSIVDTDIKDWKYCKDCLNVLAKKNIRVNQDLVV